MKKLKVACEKVKRILSTSTQTTVEADSLYEGIDFSATITLAKFDELVGDLHRRYLEQSRESCWMQRKVKARSRSMRRGLGGRVPPRIPKIKNILSNGKQLCKS